MYIEAELLTPIELPTSNKIVRSLLNFKFITDQESNVLCVCITDRNLTSHTYNETIAEKIYDHIPLYHATMKAVVDRLKFD